MKLHDLLGEDSYFNLDISLLCFQFNLKPHKGEALNFTFTLDEFGGCYSDMFTCYCVFVFGCCRDKTSPGKMIGLS